PAMETGSELNHSSRLSNPGGATSLRGYDHGVFVPLKIMLPAADVPCIQLSLHASLDPEVHFAAGEALAELRDDNVLIVGSGNSFHNMRELMARAGSPQSESIGWEFDDWLTKAITTGSAEKRRTSLHHWVEAPGARFAHPREEHLAPLFVVAGAAWETVGEKIFEDHALGVVESAFIFR
ncbi:dioxygenase, partial [Acidithiobacillus sp. CV18-2]|nr:dioxygenase [Acidithiobacillus sp. CV18-2]